VTEPAAGPAEEATEREVDRSAPQARSRRLRPLLLFAAALGGPLAFLLLLRSGTGEDLPGVNVAAEPVLAPAVPQTIDGQQRVSLALTWEEGRALRAPAWRGTITAIHAAQGATLERGSPVLAVDGVTRIAWRGETPFYRPLSQGATGPDVAELHRLLIALGHLDAQPQDAAFYSFDTTLAVRELEAALGVQPTSGAFDPTWVVWLPGNPFVLGTLDIDLADPAPAPGEEFGQEFPRLREALIQPASQSDTLAFDAGTEYLLSAGTETFEVDEANSLVPEDALPALALALQPLAENALGLVRREVVLNTLALPSTAITSNAAGGLCVWVPAGGGYEPRAVQTIASRAGVTNVTSDLGEGLEVLANPSEILADTTCP
jgi:hypothetical protein